MTSRSMSRSARREGKASPDREVLGLQVLGLQVLGLDGDVVACQVQRDVGARLLAVSALAWVDHQDGD